MRFVAVKTAKQQAILMLHKVRDLLIRQRTMLINALRGHFAEFGIMPLADLARQLRRFNASKAWAAKLLERRSARLISVALANKTARRADLY